MVIFGTVSRLATGYGMLNDAGPSLHDGVWSTVDLGCMRHDKGAMNVWLASPCCGTGAYPLGGSLAR